jgi:hypothetical protein
MINGLRGGVGVCGSVLSRYRAIGDIKESLLLLLNPNGDDGVDDDRWDTTAPVTPWVASEVSRWRRRRQFSTKWWMVPILYDKPVCFVLCSLLLFVSGLLAIKLKKKKKEERKLRVVGSHVCPGGKREKKEVYTPYLSAYPR